MPAATQQVRRDVRTVVDGLSIGLAKGQTQQTVALEDIAPRLLWIAVDRDKTELPKQLSVNRFAGSTLPIAALAGALQNAGWRVRDAKWTFETNAGFNQP